MNPSSRDREDRANDRWVPSSLPITTDDFDTVVRHFPVIVIHVWAEWNRADRKMDQTLRDVKSEFEKLIAFRSFDVDSDRVGLVTHKLGVLNVPAISCFFCGQRVEINIGLRSTGELRDWLKGIQVIRSSITWFDIQAMVFDHKS